MTQNQIAWQAHKENVKHNRNTEAETQRSNLAREVETQRSNIAREIETQRSNIANENINRFRVREESSHWLRQDSETFRHNLAEETEKRRSNLANEEINRGNVIAQSGRAIGSILSAYWQGEQTSINRENLGVNWYNAQTSRGNYYVNLTNAGINFMNAQTNERAMIQQGMHYANQDAVAYAKLPYETSQMQSRTDLINQQAKSESFNRLINLVRTGVDAFTSTTRAGNDTIRTAASIIKGGS